MNARVEVSSDATRFRIRVGENTSEWCTWGRDVMAHLKCLEGEFICFCDSSQVHPLQVYKIYFHPTDVVEGVPCG